MPIHDDGSGTYTLGPDGEKQFAHATEAKINDEILYRLDDNTGVLEICAEPAIIETIIKSVGGLPCKELILSDPFGLQPGGYHFFDIKEIKSVTNKSGEFFITVSEEQNTSDSQYESMPVYRGDKMGCDNCHVAFQSGEVVSVDESAELVFCYSDAGGGCGSAYAFSHGKMIFGNPMRFGDEYLTDNQRTPSYPNSPIFKDVNLSNSDSNKNKYFLYLFVAVAITVIVYLLFK